MEKELEALIKKRRDFIRSSDENGFSEGLHDLLSDLYPDTAHFIYELLQNAEDMDATEVHFDLSNGGIRFAHNGTKRSFTISDIDSITSIGKNRQKKDDPTSIGKFGVGFKAVFAYTATPIIHSGKYHFMILNDFLPEFDGIEQVITLDSEGVEWTKFEFPFNNPDKPVDIARQECLNGLEQLNTSTLLFLQHIKKIFYSLPGARSGYIVRDEDANNPHIITIKQKKAVRNEIFSSQWLRFHKYVDITDEKGSPKHLAIAVAFSLKKDDKSNQKHIIPIQGNTFIYFPAEKEHSGLFFHINAPFASTVARDSVRACRENNDLIRAIARLTCSSLSEIKAMGMIDFSLFEVLPNNKDYLSPFYHVILDEIIDAFKKNEYLPVRKGDGYVSSSDALTGPAAISSILTSEDLIRLFGIKRRWIQNSPQRNSRSDSFIQSLGVSEFSYERFARFFNDIRKAEKFLESKQNEWLKKFYALCADTYSRISNYDARSDFSQKMAQGKTIRSTSGKMHTADEIYILPKNEKLLTPSTPIVEQSFIIASKASDEASERILSFFQTTLRVKTYGPKVEIEKILENYNAGITIDDVYFKSMLAFADYSSKNSDINFDGCKIFIFQTSTSYYRATASELYLGQAYGNTAGETLAKIYEKNTLWDGYKGHYNEKELEQFISFAKKCGIKTDLEIIRQSASFHPLYFDKLNPLNRPSNGYGRNEDYYIFNFDKILDNSPSMEVSTLIWNCLLKNGKSVYHNYWLYPDYSKAYFSPTKSSPVKDCESSLIYRLKKVAWVPDQSGKYFKPEDIAVTNIAKELKYDANNSLLAALQFGSKGEKRAKAKAKLEEEAKAEGYRLVSEEDYQELQEIKARKNAKRIVPAMTSRELLEKQGKPELGGNGSDADFSSDGAVRNVERREKNIEATFRNAATMTPLQRRLFARTAESSKEEKSKLRNWYGGKCQMCGIRITKNNGEPYFVAKNIIVTKDLKDSIRNTTELAWNSLCLCPNCAARYDVCARNISGLYDQILQTAIIEGDSGRIVLSIELEGEEQEIRYVPKHFLALKKAFQLIDAGV